MSETVKVTFSPKFMSSFNCIGSACEDTCCAGWIVNIDQQTFEKYEKINDPELTPKLRNSIIKKNPVDGGHQFAAIKMSSTGNCPFLDPEKMCSIQRKLGPSFLSQTCDVYPRVRSSFNDHYRFSATLSCPEAARLCVGASDAMDLQELPADSDDHKKILELFPNSIEFPLSPEDFTRKMITNVINTFIKDLSLPIETTIIIYGFLAQKFLSSEAIANPHAPPSMEALLKYANELKTALSVADLTHPAAILLKLRILIKIAVMRTYGMGSRFGGLVQTASGALFKGTTDFSHASDNYQRFLIEKFRPVDAKNPFAIRNYVLNYLFTNHTFVSGDPFKAFQGLAFRVGVMKLLLIGLAGSKDDEISIADYVTIISAVSRAFDHDSVIGDNICAVIDQIEPNSISATALLIQ